MSNAFRSTAEVHKLLKPQDTRTVDELEAYYRDLSLQSPVGRVTSSLIAADTADRAITQAYVSSRVTTKEQ